MQVAHVQGQHTLYLCRADVQIAAKCQACKEATRRKRSHQNSLCAGTLQLGLVTEGIAPPPLSTPRRPHPALVPLAQLYVRPDKGTEGGGAMVELSGTPGSPSGFEDAVTLEWQRLRSLRAQNVHA